ncbi:MAG: hypothetical protein WAU86_10770, partial [Oricola sp.]
MRKAIRWFYVGVVAALLIWLTAVAVDTWRFLTNFDAGHHYRARFPSDVPLGKTICSRSAPGLLEGSAIAIYELDPGFSDRLGPGGLAILY